MTVRFFPFPPFPAEPWQRNQLAVTVSASLIFAGFTMVMPFLPLYIRMLGVQSQAQVAIWSGVVLGVSPLIASIIGPLWGRIADRYGLKIMAIRICLALFFIWLFTGFAANVYHLFILRFLLGVFGGFNTFSISLVTQLCPQDKVGRAIGTLQATQISSVAAGPFIGGLLADWIGIRKTFFVTSLMCLISLFLFLFLYTDRSASGNQPGSEAVQQARVHNLKSLTLLPNFGVLAVLLFVITAIDRSFNPLIPLFVTELIAIPGEAARTAGIIISLAALGESLAAWYSGRKIFRTAPKKFLLLRLAFGALISLGLSMATTISQLFCLRVLLALLAGGTLTTGYTLASRVIPEEKRSTAFGLLSSFAMLGGAAGPLVGGALASIRLSSVFLVHMVSYALLFGLVWRRVRELDPSLTVGPSQERPVSHASPADEL